MMQSFDPAADAAPAIDLAGRVALVTGGGGGLGRATAKVLVACGASVVVADLPGERLEAAVKELSEFGEVFALATDLSVPEQCRAAPREAQSLAGKPISILVNAVGIMRTRPPHEITDDDWQQTLDVNLTGVFHTLRAAAEIMQAGDGGAIVSLSSVAGRSGRANAFDYAATKTALLSLTKSAALAYGPKVRVNAVCPGVFLTDMWAGIVADRDREFGPGAGQQYLDELGAKTPMQRVGDPEELANTIAFLVSDLASFVTGQALNVDGGLEMD